MYIWGVPYMVVARQTATLIYFIRFHPSHQLFSRLINHSKVSLTIPLFHDDEAFVVVAYFKQSS